MGALPLLALLAATAGHSAAQRPPPADCLVALTPKENLPNPQPLLLKPGGSKNLRGFVAPNRSGKISFRRGEQMIIACPNENNTISVIKQPQAIASCESASTFSIDGQPYNFTDLYCVSQPKPSAMSTTTSCGGSGQYQVVHLGFQVGSDFYTLIDACFDHHRYTTVYDHFTMLSTIGYHQKGFGSFGWLTDGFFDGIDMRKAYNPTSQQETVGTLLGSIALGQMYIQERNHSFLARGHLTARFDFIFGAQQYATFLYLNAVPQWQTMNQGNWETMENFVRSYALQKATDLEIYTGTHGITTLPNVSDVDTELYLHVEQNKKYLPVPKIFWKIVFKPATKAAVVLVTANNPYIDDPFPGGFCNDVCGNIKEPNWERTNKILGYSYCCEYRDFKTRVPDAPVLDVDTLLTFK